jgi:hypothetical protein
MNLPNVHEVLLMQSPAVQMGDPSEAETSETPVDRARVGSLQRQGLLWLLYYHGSCKVA